MKKREETSLRPTKSLLERLIGSFGRILSIVRKELFVILCDKGSRAILIAPVFIQAVLFGYGATFNLERAPWCVYDESRSALSREFIRGVEASGFFDMKRDARSAGEFEMSIDTGESLIGLRFPTNFAKTGEAYLVTDARNSTTAGVAAGYVAAVAAKLNASPLEPASGPSVKFNERYRFNENGITRYAIVPALIIALALIQVLILSALSVSREREDGSFDMMLMTPATSVEILIGKAVVPTVIACLQAFLIFAIGILWFEIPFAGSLMTLGVFVFGFSLSMVGLGLAVSAVASNIQQSIVSIIFLMLPMIILSGLFTSIRAMPEWMQTITFFNPLRASITGLRAIYFEGASLIDVLPIGWPVVLVAVISMGTALRLFRTKIV